MIACHGRVQREGEVAHVVTDRLEDLTGLLRQVVDHDFTPTTGRGDEARWGGTPDARHNPKHKPRDIFAPERLTTSNEGGIKVPTRDFR